MGLRPPFPKQQPARASPQMLRGVRVAAAVPTASSMHFQPEGSFEVLALKSSWIPAETTGNGEPHPKSLTASTQAWAWRFSGETLYCLSPTHRFLPSWPRPLTLSKGTGQPGIPEPRHTVLFLFSDRRIRDKTPGLGVRPARNPWSVSSSSNSPEPEAGPTPPAAPSPGRPQSAWRGQHLLSSPQVGDPGWSLQWHHSVLSKCEHQVRTSSHTLLRC